MFYQTGNIIADHDDAGTLITLVALNMLGVASVGGILLLLAGAGPVL